MSKPSKSDTGKGKTKGKAGAPRQNRNALRHGLRAGQLPKGAKYIELRLNAFRRQLEDVVLKVKGEVSLSDAAYIQTALRWERHAALAQRWLTKEDKTLKASEKLTFSREIAQSSSKRDDAIWNLGLDEQTVENLWAVIDSPKGKGSQSVLEDEE